MVQPPTSLQKLDKYPSAKYNMVERGSVLDFATKSPLFGIGALILIVGMFTKITLLTYIGVGIAMIGALGLRR